MRGGGRIAGRKHVYLDSMKRLQTLLILDAFLLAALVVLMVPRSSLAVHEWLGFAIIPVAIIHPLFAWQWIATAPDLAGCHDSVSSRN
jgi:hypothetical protein